MTRADARRLSRLLRDLDRDRRALGEPNIAIGAAVVLLGYAAAIGCAIVIAAFVA